GARSQGREPVPRGAAAGKIPHAPARCVSRSYQATAALPSTRRVIPRSFGSGRAWGHPPLRHKSANVGGHTFPAQPPVLVPLASGSRVSPPTPHTTRALPTGPEGG